MPWCFEAWSSFLKRNMHALGILLIDHNSFEHLLQQFHGDITQRAHTNYPSPLERTRLLILLIYHVINCVSYKNETRTWIIFKKHDNADWRLMSLPNKIIEVHGISNIWIFVGLPHFVLLQQMWNSIYVCSSKFSMLLPSAWELTSNHSPAAADIIPVPSF